MDTKKIRDVCRSAFVATVGFKRCAGSRTEALFVAELAKGGPTLIDQAGNLHFDRRQGKSKTLFCAHTDTVHHHNEEGENTFAIGMDGKVEKAFAAGDSVLGADDGAGIAILLTMMAMSIPGYYIFFRQEECGGVGSTYFAESFGPLMKTLDRAVAFDRAGYGDVISHQAGGRCCSDEFADALANALNDLDDDFMFSNCDGGVFTDTANLTNSIPECTNLSVGYLRQHTVKEEQSITFMLQLAQAACKLDWEKLPTKRDPSEIDDVHHYFGLNKFLNTDYKSKKSKKAQTYVESEIDRECTRRDNLYSALDSASIGKYAALKWILVRDEFVPFISKVPWDEVCDSDWHSWMEDVDNIGYAQTLELIADCLRSLIPDSAPDEATNDAKASIDDSTVTETQP